MIWTAVLYRLETRTRRKEGRYQKIGGLRDVDMANAGESPLDGTHVE